MSVGKKNLRQRKQRSDKKHSISPTICLDLKDSIYRLSFVTGQPVKDVCELLVLHAVGNEEIIKRLSKHLQRSIGIQNTVYVGSLQNEKISRNVAETTERIFFRVKRDLHEKIYALSYALDCSVSRVSSLLLYESITDTAFIEKHVEDYVDSLDKSRKKELRQLLKYIKAETNEAYSIVELLAYLVDEPINWTFPNN